VTEDLLTQYKVSMQTKSPWQVGYHQKHDEMFLFFVDQDDLVWVFGRGRLDGVGFFEFMNFDDAVLLGDL